MSQQNIKNPYNIKEKLRKYGVLLGYTFIGFVGLGYFSYKIIMVRHANMQKYKQKSRIPLLHKNMKYLGVGGLLCVILYSYGLWEVIKRVPQSQTNIQMADYSQLSQVNRKDPEMQDYYIIKTMRLFGVSEYLIDKTKNQFKSLGLININQKSQNMVSELFKALINRKKIQQQIQKVSQQIK